MVPGSSSSQRNESVIKRNDLESARWDRLDRKEGELWRYALWLGTLLAVAVAASSWEHLKSLPLNLQGIPVGVVVLTVLFAIYAYNKRIEILELRAFIRGLRERNDALPNSQQLNQLFSIVNEPQRGYRDLIDSFEDSVFSLGLDGKIHACNRRLEELFEEPAAALVGHDLAEFLSEPDRSLVETALPRFLEKRSWNGTVKIRIRKSGGVRYYDTALQAIVEQGQVVGISALARDVTTAREREAHFTELFETLQEGIYVRSASGEILNANPALAKMLGYATPEELLQRSWHDLCSASIVAGNGEIRLRRKNGGEVVCASTSTPLYDALGKVVRYQGTLVDITHKKEIEEHLHQEREFVQRLVSNFPDVITALDREGRYTFITPRMAEITGYSTEQLMGQPFGSMIAPEDFSRVRDAFFDLITGRQSSVSVEYRGFHKDGSPRVFLTSASPLTGSNGEITGVVASTRDLTERRRLEQQVVQSEKLAAMGRMIAGVAHELNNPLTVILGASDTAGTRELNEGTRRHFELIHQQARRTAEIVQNLLSFSRPPSPERKPLDLDDLVQRALQLSEYSLRVNCVTADTLPTRGLPLIAGDSSQLIQVLLNLISNAEQAIREVRERGTIRIRTGSGSGKVWVSFHDDGPGIGSNILPNIFDPFFTTKRSGRGTGLGLSICLSIVREHGGTIEAHHAPDGGAVFVVTLPEAKYAALPIDSIQAPAVLPELRGRSVLVVDDEPGILDLVRMTLSNREMRVECCRGADEALESLCLRHFDFILCDMKMPIATGKDLYERSVERFGKLAPFILMAGDPTDPVTVEFVRTSGVPLLRKPFTISDLIRAFSSQVDNKAISKAS